MLQQQISGRWSGEWVEEHEPISVGLHRWDPFGVKPDGHGQAVSLYRPSNLPLHSPASAVPSLPSLAPAPLVVALLLDRSPKESDGPVEGEEGNQTPLASGFTGSSLSGETNINIHKPYLPTKKNIIFVG